MTLFVGETRFAAGEIVGEWRVVVESSSHLARYRRLAQGEDHVIAQQLDLGLQIDHAQ